MNSCLVVGCCAALLVVTADNRPAWGHGTPIEVDVAGDADDATLTRGNGVHDPYGWATMVFADPLEDSAFLSAPQDRLLTDFPGLDLNNVEPGVGVSLEVLAQPDFTTGGAARTLWYWSPESEAVGEAPNDQTLLLYSTFGFGQSLLAQFDAPPPALQVANPDAADLGVHRHFLYYILNDAPPALHGAYAFYARLVSPAYGPSEPFLLALNYGLSPDEFLRGALSINSAAQLPGDADRNHSVDLADFNLLKTHFGADAAVWADGDFNADGAVDLADFNILKEHFGVSAAVPEPSAWLLAAACGGGLALRRAGTRRRQSSSSVRG